jgi:hypothetical protein
MNMKTLIKLLILTFILVCSEKSFSKNSYSVKKDSLLQPKTEVKSKIDTIIIIQKSYDEEIIKKYSQILEKTNNQLSLLYNPYGLFVAMLGVLFTVAAILVAIIIYRQSKEYKELIKKSYDEHNLAFEQLIREKEKQMESLQLSFDKTISEYKMKLSTVEGERKTQIEKFIDELEVQKDFLSSQIHTYTHSGWEYKDIQINYPINQYSRFYARIELNQGNQLFTIYIQIRTKNNKYVWIGFAGNSGESLPLRTRNEYKVDIGTTPDTIKLIINENIYKYFNEGFYELKTEPVEVVSVRLRASDENTNSINFSFRIS